MAEQNETYRSFWDRHFATIITASISVIAIVASSSIAVWQVIENREAQKENREAQKQKTQLEFIVQDVDKWFTNIQSEEREEYINNVKEIMKKGHYRTAVARIVRALKRGVLFLSEYESLSQDGEYSEDGTQQFILLLDNKERYYGRRFSMGVELQEHLENEKNLEQLRQQFKDNGVELPEEVTIREIREQKTWEVYDEHRNMILYIIKKEDNSLNIYYYDNYYYGKENQDRTNTDDIYIALGCIPQIADGQIRLIRDITARGWENERLIKKLNPRFIIVHYSCFFNEYKENSGERHKSEERFDKFLERMNEYLKSRKEVGSLNSYGETRILIYSRQRDIAKEVRDLNNKYKDLALSSFNVAREKPRTFLNPEIAEKLRAKVKSEFEI